MSRRTKLVFGAFIVAVSSAAPALAQGRQGCGIGTRVSFFSSTAGKSGNGEMNGAF